ncbi:MAG: NUDIX hydrolase [Candidatus Micrarchaeia archaeon]
MKTIYKDKFLEFDKIVAKRKKQLQSQFDVIKEKNAVVIIPFHNGKLVMERQYRQAIRKFIYELPAGHIEKGESAKHAAARELAEETGYRALDLRYLFSAYTSPGNLTEKEYFYLATKLKKGMPHKEPNEIIEVKEVNIEIAKSMLAKKELEDMKTIAGIEFCMLHKELFSRA